MAGLCRQLGDNSTVPEKRVHLTSSDNQKFVVDESVAFEAQTLKDMIADFGVDTNIPLPNITGSILSKVIEFCEHAVEIRSKAHDGNPVPEYAILEWNNEFVNIDQQQLFDLIMAANYLNIKNLLDLTCQQVANMIASKTPEEIRNLFNIENDFTPEEEAEVRKLNNWAFD